MCFSYNNEKVLEYFKHPDKIISEEIFGMQKQSDNAYIALAIFVVFNNKIDKNMFSSKTDIILKDIINESILNQCPTIQTLRLTLPSLIGEFVMDNEMYYCLLGTQLFDVCVTCLGGSFVESILKYSSSIFIKERLQILPTLEKKCSYTITVQRHMVGDFFRRLTTDMNNNFIADVLGNKLFESEEYRGKFVSYLYKHVNSETLTDASTGSNVLHIVSSLGYLDFLKYFLKKDNYKNINKANSRMETPCT
ncbi:unnamed protein product [Mytilus edulis]|uniref:Uncharacterized protein n=1 Tax=Mytilus edulis TaxID=6550 RepID=A0A8S3UMA1_MYTED|nr:unnamed protein product [Mytilus edulis]